MWKCGSLPPNTWNCGGVIPVGYPGTGFYFADFCGDHVKIYPDEKVLKPEEIAYYDNCLELPVAVKSQVDQA